ncbi:MAG: hydantoinase B/oxoprolinase family protein [Planctomycetota bacterium]
MKTSRRQQVVVNAIEVEIFRQLFESIADEMGVVLQRTAFSPNIKERLDFSCALADAEGSMLAQAAHIPVHLGSCHLTTKEVFAACTLQPGDVVVLNDPFRGGTHLPDITMVAPVFAPDGKRLCFGVVARAHHADVGGGVPGSMGNFDEIYKEGLIIPPVKLVAAGSKVDDVEALVLANVRTPDERRGDLAAQIASVQRGVERIEALMSDYGIEVLAAAGKALMARSARALGEVLKEIPDGLYRASDRLDGEGSAKIAVQLVVKGSKLTVDFKGSSPSVAEALNAHEAITLSCLFYALRCLADESIPTNSGLLAPVQLLVPKGSIVGAVHPAAVAGGNVETSQRIVDVIFRALAEACPGLIPADSQGTMNNLSFGGKDRSGRVFTYFETIAGGLGAGKHHDGASGMHSHMTNTLNTPIEALEVALPLRVRAYHLRRNSGGSGRHPGGDGVVREFEALDSLEVSLLTTRRLSAPSGRAGGGDAKPGCDHLIDASGRRRKLNPKSQFVMKPGETLRIETPGGGGYGKRVSRG